MRFKGKTVVVTGGASGIGEATVRAVVGEGGNAVIADLQDERGSGWPPSWASGPRSSART